MEEYLRREVITTKEREEWKSVIQCEEPSKVGGGATIQREGTPERQGSSGNPCWRLCQALQTGWLSEKRRVKRKPAMLYSPRGDFKSIVKRMEVKLRYTSADRESKFCVFRYFVYFLTLSLSGCFLQRYFPDLYIEPESALYIKQNSHKLRQFYILIPVTAAFYILIPMTVNFFFIFRVFFFPLVFYFENVHIKTLWGCSVAGWVCVW